MGSTVKKVMRPEVLLNLFNISNRKIGLIMLNYFLNIKQYHVSNRIILCMNEEHY